MKIATCSVNGITARLPILLRRLEESARDIACLQELKAPQERFPEEAIREAGYSAIWHGRKSRDGAAPLSRGEKPFDKFSAESMVLNLAPSALYSHCEHFAIDTR